MGRLIPETRRTTPPPPGPVPAPASDSWALALVAARDGVWDCDLRTGTAWYSPRYAEMLGFTPEELPPRMETWAALVHPQDLAAVERTMDAHLAGQTPWYEHEYRMRAKDGSWRWILARGQVVARDPEGRPLRVAGTHVDLTARTERAREEARQAADQFRLAVRASHMGTWHEDVVTRTTTWSVEMEQLFGLEPGTFGGTPAHFMALVHPDDRERITVEMRAAIAETDEFRLQFRVPLPDGSVRWVESMGHVIRDAQGRTTRALGVALDVTDRVQEQQASAAFASRMALIGDVAAALVGAITPEEVGQVFMERAVPALGASSGVLYVRAGEHLALLATHGVDEEIRRRAALVPLDSDLPVAETVRTGRPFVGPRRPRTPQGSDPEQSRIARAYSDRIGTTTIASLPLPGPADGSVGGALGFAWVAPRTFAEADEELFDALAALCAQALERARLYAAAEAARAQAVEANRAKSDFLAKMSHELRTPLNAIAGYTDLLELGVHGPVNEAQQDALLRVKRSQRHLLGLIDDLLSFARLDAGRVQFDLRVVPLAEPLRTVEQLLRPQVEARGLACEIATGDGLAAWADHDKVAQILVNLVGNAVKYTPTGGRVSVRCAADDGVVRVHVQDTGIGIPADRLESIFDPFVQVRRGLNQPADGVGLGLAISRDLARGMGGEITVESDERLGSVFTLTLPAAPAV